MTGVRFSLFILLFASLAFARDPVPKKTFNSKLGQLTIDWLDEGLIKVEYRFDGKSTPETGMVSRTSFPGPGIFEAGPSSKLVSELKTSLSTLRIAEDSLCLTVFAMGDSEALTSICPTKKSVQESGLSVSQESTTHLYGLGQHFDRAGETDGDWLGRVRESNNEFGNAMVGFNGGFNGDTQIPILYALGKGRRNFGLFLDDISKQRWDFTSKTWKVDTKSPSLRFYLLVGKDLTSLRKSYLALTGRPPVPPKKMFGLWVSEYGYRSWEHIESKLATLRQHKFPIDGFVLDLYWFGGIKTGSEDSRMGSLSWDSRHFPNPEDKLASLSKEGIGVMLIEESYIAKGLPEHERLENAGYLARQPDSKNATYFGGHSWWGRGGMIDWTNPDASRYWHETKRKGLVSAGVIGHWLDLGEPEMYSGDSKYFSGKSHAEVHNVYNLKWAESVYEGYLRSGEKRRPFILTRSGTSGSQRYGVALWSGDIGSDLSSLAAHAQSQMHLVLSGIDYYGSDVGGFYRNALKTDLNEMYTQWFANAAAFDIPIRPHTENIDQKRETAPDRVGDRESNLANLRFRYELTPYLYSLAHVAYREGEPIVAPLVYHFQDDEKVRRMGGQKMLGSWLMAPVVARSGAKQTDVYFPKGKWTDFRTHRSFVSSGDWQKSLELYVNGKFQLPFFARSGAIIPKMYVDEKTKDSSGNRTDGTRRGDWIARVYPDPTATEFTVYEDDGETIAYRKGEVMRTVIRQQILKSVIRVTIQPSQGDFRGSTATRVYALELVSPGQSIRSLHLNRRSLPRFDSLSEWEASTQGWVQGADGLVRVKSSLMGVKENKVFEARLDF